MPETYGIARLLYLAPKSSTLYCLEQRPLETTARPEYRKQEIDNWIDLLSNGPGQGYLDALIAKSLIYSLYRCRFLEWRVVSSWSTLPLRLNPPLWWKDVCAHSPFFLPPPSLFRPATSTTLVLLRRSFLSLALRLLFLLPFPNRLPLILPSSSAIKVIHSPSTSMCTWHLSCIYSYSQFMMVYINVPGCKLRISCSKIWRL